MRFTGPDAAAVARGEITLAFRRWARPRVVAGRVYRTNGGRLVVGDIRAIAESSVTDVDARRAGRAAAAQLLAALPGDRAHPVWRIEFGLAADPDPRALLAADNMLDTAAHEDLTRRLDRLDRASSHGAWTRATLRAIGARPGVRAPDLASSFGREAAPFKIDVRKLKNLGLTHSLAVGYELSPRGRAFLTGAGAGADGAAGDADAVPGS